MVGLEEDEDWEDEDDLRWKAWQFYLRTIKNSDTAFLPIEALRTQLESQAVKQLGSRKRSVRNAFDSWEAFAEQVFEMRITCLRKQLQLTLWAALAVLATPLAAWWQAGQLLEGEGLQLAWQVPFFIVATLMASAIAAAIAVVVIGGLAASISHLAVTGLYHPEMARRRKADAWERLTMSG